MISKEKALERAFNKANLIGENVDLYEIIYQYKVLRELSEEEIDKIYDQMSKALGFNR